MDPSAPSQPSQQTSLDQSQNAASKTTEEANRSNDPSATAQPPIDHRSHHDVTSTHSHEATGSALGRGDTGPLKEKSIPESDAQQYSGGDSGLEGEQMRAPGEGEVADAVVRGTGKTGAGGEEASLSRDMDAKTEAHKQALHERGERTGAEIEEEEREDWTGKKKSVDLGEALGGRGMAVVEAPEN